MAFFQFFCPEGNLIDELRKTFNMTPLKVPDNQTQPLKIVAHRGTKSTIWGPIESLFEGSNQSIDLKPEMAEVAGVSIKKTDSFNTKFGFNLLEGMLRGFGVKIEPFEASLSNAEEISLSFENVVRKTFPITTLGRELMNKKINLDNPAMNIFTRQKNQYGMYLISSVLQSNRILIHIDKKKDDSLEVGLPKLAGITEGKVNLEEKSGQKRIIAFEGKTPLTFAFSAIELMIAGDGSIKFGETKILKTRGAGGEEKREIAPQEVSFIEEDAPALMGWNSRVE